LVGGSHNGERQDLLLLYDTGGHMLRGAFSPVWERTASAGMVLASLGAFLVLEARDHAEARGARPLARLSAVLSERSSRAPGSVTAALGRMWENLRSRAAGRHIAVISGATGAEPATDEERAWIATIPGVPVRATGSLLGHGLEPQIVMNIALAVLVLGHQKLFPATDLSGIEQGYDGPLDAIAVTAVGHWRGEGMALVEAVN
jgi:3-oxoacyl-[acyl-carrier-protein] synthase II